VNASRIYNLLADSENSAVTIAVLSERAALPRREVEAAIQQLRWAGYPVCASGKGVWCGTTEAEIEREMAGLKSRALNILRSRKGLRKALDKLRRDQQLALFEEAA
jgi:hypothetical protein